MSLVVVGVDGSPGGQAALRFALEEARLRGATLRAVCAWEATCLGAVGIEAASRSVEGEREELRCCAESLLERALADAAADAAGVEIERHVVEGPAAVALARASRDAELLVIGSHSHGGVGELLHGAVRHQLVHHAGCPVTLVHTAAETGGLAVGSSAPRARLAWLRG